MGIFTLCESNILTPFLLNFDLDMIVSAASMTLLIFFILVAVAYKNRNKEYSIGRYMLQLIVAELVLGLLMTFFFRVDSILVSFIQSILTVGYILVDLHLVMNNKTKMLTIDDHVYASMMIYADLIRLFIKILEIMEKLNGKKKKNKK